MKLFPRQSLFGLKYKHWTYPVALAYVMKGVMNEHPAFVKFYHKLAIRDFCKKWLKTEQNQTFFDFNGPKLTDISNDTTQMINLLGVFDDVLLFHCFQNDDYNKDMVRYFDQFLNEGPYGYTDGSFDVTVKKGDVVVDVGAWIGDFSAYACSKGAVAYAFEPVKNTFELLEQTAILNNVNGGVKIYPVNTGLSNVTGTVEISINNLNSGSNSIVYDWKGNVKETINLTTLDQFVIENKLKTVDFIKADIEGAERDMLRGANYVMKTFAPKLAICTYHLPDDPEVLENIIKTANPNYTIVHLKHKLFAQVVK